MKIITKTLLARIGFIFVNGKVKISTVVKREGHFWETCAS